MNFSFLSEIKEYEMFSHACIEAERTLTTSPAMCAVGCRKALELAVKWVFAADAEIQMPYKDNLSALVHEYTFRKVVDERTWKKLPFVIKLGNLSVHTDRKVSHQDAMLALKVLFEFVEWIDYCYGPDYTERKFDERQIPAVKMALDIKAIKERESLIAQKDEDIKRLEDQIRALQEQFAQAKQTFNPEEPFNPDEISEYETRCRYIDLDLEYAGWDKERNILTEVEVEGMPNNKGIGYIDYVLNGKDGKPLAIVEAKRTMLNPQKGLQQARLYAQCLKEKYGYLPFIFLTNGFVTYFVDDEIAPERQCSGVFSPEDLLRMKNRRGATLPLNTVPVNKDISGRYYQIEAIQAICNNMSEGHRRSLLVMATGTGKTRTAAGLVDVLTRANHVTNVLFLADRIALVSQAKHAFQQYLPNMSVCNLCNAKDKAENKDARIIFSTYPTILNAIDSVKADNGDRLFTAAHFDLIIVDEAHRSIFKKYKTIFDYFDAQVVGLTATPKDEVDRNTYDFFEVEHGVPTYVYDYDTAVNKDHFLVPYYNIETETEFLKNGIHYDDLSPEDQARLEEDWEETYNEKLPLPEHLKSSLMNKLIFNEDTIGIVLEKLLEKGIKVNGGERLGKTIIFAQNKNHAEKIVEVFKKKYPKLARGGFIRRVVHEDDYSSTLIDEFKLKEYPVIAVSVDMMDTGVDVPELVNLVFFKSVKSKTKFWQMIGRGTRLCPDLWPVDGIDGEYSDKKRFYIFDFCGNFEYFRQGKNAADPRMPESLSETVMKRQVELVQTMQQSAFVAEEYQKIRSNMVYEMVSLVSELKEEPLSTQVKMKIRAVDKFSSEHAYEVLSDADVTELQREVAPLVSSHEKDQYALRFDSSIYGFMNALNEATPTEQYRGYVLNIARDLSKKMTIPQVKEKYDIITRILNTDYLENAGILDLENIRLELRHLNKFTDSKYKRIAALHTNLKDSIISQQEGQTIDSPENSEDYRHKVNRYIYDNGNQIIIHKLTHNEPMTEFELQELERIFTEELGSKEQYHAAFGDTPFGILVRKVAKLDRTAAMEVFADFINDETLVPAQIAFVNKVVDFLVQNGTIEMSDLFKAPFDRPAMFIKLFDQDKRQKISELIQGVKNNATGGPAA